LASEYYVTVGVDLSLVKIDSAGNVLWVIHEETTEFDRGTNIALDSANNMYFIGYNRGSLVGVNPSDGFTFDYFTIKYNTDGKHLWGTATVVMIANLALESMWHPMVIFMYAASNFFILQKWRA
jgi:hypothetical protein